MKDIGALLRALLFEGPTELQELVQPVELSYGVVLTQEGEEDSTLLLVDQGEVSLRRSGIEVATAGPGELVGEAEFFGSSERTLTARSVDHGRGVLIEREAYDLLHQAGHPAAAVLERLVLAQVVQRLRRYFVRIAELVRETGAEREVPVPGVRERVATTLGLWGSRTDVDRVEALRSNPRLAGVPADALGVLAASMTARSYREGQAICRAGEPATNLFLLLQGMVEVVVSTDLDRGGTVACVGPGSVFGGVSMIAGQPRMASCLAVDDAEVLALDARHWNELLADHSAAASAIRRAVASALSHQTLPAVIQLASLEETYRDQLVTALGAPPPRDDDGETSLLDLAFRR